MEARRLGGREAGGELGPAPSGLCVFRPPGGCAEAALTPVNKAACKSFMGLCLKIDEVRPLDPLLGLCRARCWGHKLPGDAGGGGGEGCAGGPQLQGCCRARRAQRPPGNHHWDVPSGAPGSPDWEPTASTAPQAVLPLTLAITRSLIGPQRRPYLAPHRQTGTQGPRRPRRHPIEQMEREAGYGAASEPKARPTWPCPAPEVT